MNKEHLATDLGIQHSNNFVCMNNNFVIKFLYVTHNFKHNSKDYDERGLGVHFIQGQWYAIIQRTYF